MTQDEFNDKYSDYLEDGFFGLDMGHSATEEIVKFLDKIFEDVLTKIPGFKYNQIKTKFGYARFYTNIWSTELMTMIESQLNEMLGKITKTDNTKFD